MKIGAIELKVQRNVQYTGRRCRIGRIAFNEDDRMVVFVGYCPDCKAKITMSIPDARKFANMYVDESRANRLLRIKQRHNL